MEPQVLVVKGAQYVALLLALCVHECSHAAAAKVLGDPTAEDEGRLTLSPIAHADFVGTVLLPLFGLFFSSWLFGWARPVPVQPSNFRRGWFSRGQILVAAAGPVSNLLQALLWAGVHFVLVRFAPTGGEGAMAGVLDLIRVFVQASVIINLVLMAFNFLPVPPLDGSHVVSWGLPRDLGEKYDAFMRAHGFMVLIALLVPIWGGHSAASIVVRPCVRFGWILLGG